MNNPYFNSFYERCIKEIAKPLFPRGRTGMGNMMRYLSDGNVVALLVDQYMSHGEPLKFFGHTAYTATSAAKLALKHDALLITFYVVRKDDGVNFDLVFESPVKPSTPSDMTQILNDRLEKQIRKNMGQWLWTHRRWKSALYKIKVNSLNAFCKFERLDQNLLDYLYLNYSPLAFLRHRYYLK